MLVGILSKTWWTSLVKSDDRAPEEPTSAPNEDATSEQPSTASREAVSARESASVRDQESARDKELEGAARETPRSESPRREPRPSRNSDRRDHRNDPKRHSRKVVEAEDDHDDDEDEVDVHTGDASAGIEDPLALPYDEFEREPSRGRSRRGGDSRDAHAPAHPRVRTAKEYFTTEILYRYDILEREERSRLARSCRVELKGNKGGVWTITAQDELQIVNRREDAELVFTMQHRDFLALVNGDLNPQLAMLAQKIRVQGDFKKAVHGLSLFAPAAD